MIDQDELCIPTMLYNSNFEQRKKMPVPLGLVAHIISDSKITGIQGQSRLQSKTLFQEEGRKRRREGEKKEPVLEEGRGRIKKQLLSFVQLSVRKCCVGVGGIKEMEIKAVKIFEMLPNTLPIEDFQVQAGITYYHSHLTSIICLSSAFYFVNFMDYFISSFPFKTATCNGHIPS